MDASPPLEVVPAPKRPRRRYNRDAERWVWANIVQAWHFRHLISVGFHPSENVQVVETFTHGRGLKSLESFVEGDGICLYGGRFMRIEEADAIADTSSYDVDITDGWVMKIEEAHIGEDGAPGGFCNDPNPPASIPNVWRAREDPAYVARNNTAVNARIRRRQIIVGPFEDRRTLQVLIIAAILPINAGDEIFIEYGTEYWENRRHLFVAVPEHQPQ